MLPPSVKKIIAFVIIAFAILGVWRYLVFTQSKLNSLRNQNPITQTVQNNQPNLKTSPDDHSNEALEKDLISLSQQMESINLEYKVLEQFTLDEPLAGIENLSLLNIKEEAEKTANGALNKLRASLNRLNSLKIISAEQKQFISDSLSGKISEIEKLKQKIDIQNNKVSAIGDYKELFSVLPGCGLLERQVQIFSMYEKITATVDFMDILEVKIKSRLSILGSSGMLAINHLTESLQAKKNASSIQLESVVSDNLINPNTNLVPKINDAIKNLSSAHDNAAILINYIRESPSI